LAVEYAYRYAKDYTYRFMVNASSTTTLNEDYKRIAGYMGLTLPADAKPEAVIAAVQHWLDNNTGYLMILDNADFSADYTAEQLQEFLPHNPQGHLLITSRAQALPANLNVMANDVLALGVLSETEAVELLTTRVKGRGAILPTAEQEAALALAKELGYLALALEQAAAYIATKKTTFAAYLNVYRKESLRLLEKNKAQTGGYKHTVATTWSISFEEVAKAEPAAADLLTLCAFLAPENIFDVMVISAADGVIESIQAFSGNIDDVEVESAHCNELWEYLLNYSLVTKNEKTDTFSIHRLVQTVRRDTLTLSEQIQWTKTAVKVADKSLVVTQYFKIDFFDWIVSHCQTVIDNYLFSDDSNLELAHLCFRTATYRYSQGHYLEAEQLYDKALTIQRKELPEDHIDIANTLNNFASILNKQGRYDEAAELLKEALKIWHQTLPENHPDIATTLSNLAIAYIHQKRSTDAEALLNEALQIRTHTLPEDDFDISTSLNDLAVLYDEQERFDEAEQLYNKALTIRRKAMRTGHRDITVILNNMASFYMKQKRYTEAEPLLNESLAICREELPENHPDVATTVGLLGLFYQGSGNYHLAKKWYQEALDIRRNILPENHRDIADSLKCLAIVYFSRGHDNEVIPLYEEALKIEQSVLPENHIDIAFLLSSLAYLYKNQGRFSEAKQFYSEALQIHINLLGESHSSTKLIEKEIRSLHYKMRFKGRI